MKRLLPLAILAASFTGCTGIPASEGKKLADTAGNDHLKRVEADTTMTEEQKQTVRDTWARWDDLVEAAQ